MNPNDFAVKYTRFANIESFLWLFCWHFPLLDQKAGAWTENRFLKCLYNILIAAWEWLRCSAKQSSLEYARYCLFLFDSATIVDDKFRLGLSGSCTGKLKTRRILYTHFKIYHLFCPLFSNRWVCLLAPSTWTRVLTGLFLFTAQLSQSSVRILTTYFFSALLPKLTDW